MWAQANSPSDKREPRPVCHGGSAIPNSAFRNPHPAAFTLIETALAVVIVGVGVLAIVSAQQAFHQQNLWSQHVGTALMLANEIREMTMHLPRHDPITGKDNWGPEGNEWTGAPHASVKFFNDLDDFAGPLGQGVTFAPPIDANRDPIPNMDGWSQVVTVESVLENMINGAAAPPGSTEMMRLTCRVLYQGPRATEATEISRLTWIVAGRP